MTASSISKEEYAEIFSNFILEIGYRMPTWGLNFSLQAPVTSYFERQPWDPNIKTKAVKMGHWMSPGLGMCYPYLSTEVQIAHAIFATYVLFIDDVAGEIQDALEVFQHNLITQKPQKSPVLQSLVEFLQEFGKLFGPYGAQ